MQDFIDFLDKEQILRNLKEFYEKTIFSKEEDLFLDKILENLKTPDIDKNSMFNKTDFDSNNLDLDIFSSLYESSLDHKNKKRGGEFYTPISVVNYILKAIGYFHLNSIENKQIIDISCGSGSFIIQSIRFLVKRCLEIYKRKRISELALEEAKAIISRVKSNVYGVDINRIACILCQINMYFMLYDILKLIKNSDPDYQIPHFNIKNYDALTLDYKDKYDYVVGNPPYLFLRDIPTNQREIIESGNFETKEGQYDYYQIFLELGIKILNNSGLLGYIVPDSLLALSNRKIIREYIYNKTKIREISHTGPKFNDPIVSNVILILEKENNDLERRKNQIIIKISKSQENTISQEIIEQWNYNFLIHLNSIDISILDIIHKNFCKLGNLNKKFSIKTLLSRGVELSKTGKIIFCQNCRKYLPLPKNLLICTECNKLLSSRNIEKIIYDKIPKDEKKENFKLFLYAINRYQNTQYKYINTSKVGINYKKLIIYEDRIILRQISQNNRICATYDKKLSLTSQSFYNLKIEMSPISEFNHFYLLGLINSILFSYFFIKSFGTYKKLFPRILIEKIKDFPIKIPISQSEKEKAKKIIENVKLILEDTNQWEHLQKSIDLFVFDLYQISESNRNYILNYIKNFSV